MNECGNKPKRRTQPNPRNKSGQGSAVGENTVVTLNFVVRDEQGNVKGVSENVGE
jgi:hypothetical protein